MRTKIETIINASREARTDQDWEKIDQQISALADVDPNQAAQVALAFVTDQDSRVRDTTASILTFLPIDDPQVMATSVNHMINMAKSDRDVFASGRAATFLLKHQENDEYKLSISQALYDFKSRAVINNWNQDLIQNIPNPQLHQLLISNQSNS
jgi:hypothetical protein